MLTSERVHTAIEKAVGEDWSAPRVFAALEGTVMAQCYLAGIQTNKQFVELNATLSLADGVNRFEQAIKLGLA